jgi:DNA-binding NarL/FixJ family response regulator
MPREGQSAAGAAFQDVTEKPARPHDTQARILIVEDDYFVATALEQVFVDAGFEVVGIAVTAEEALHLAHLHRPALAVMDIRLAGARDGIDAAVELRSRLRIGSIFATAHGDETTRTRADKAKPLGWLIKPYAVKTVLETIRAILAAANLGNRT